MLSKWLIPFLRNVLHWSYFVCPALGPHIPLWSLIQSTKLCCYSKYICNALHRYKFSSCVPCFHTLPSALHRPVGYMGPFLCSQKLTQSDCGRRILILNGTKFELSVYEKWQFYTVSLRPVLHFSSVSALFHTGVLKNNINRMHAVARTNKYR